MDLHPFRALRPPAALAGRVLCPPYDTVDDAEARAFAAASPLSFMRVVRAEVDLPSDLDPHDPSVYGKAADNLTTLVREGTLVREEVPALWAYRLDWGPVSQTGLVGLVSVDDYREGRIKRHEHTRRDKEDDRTNHIRTVGAHTGMVFLACRAPEGLAALLERATEGPPDLDAVGVHEVRHRLWRLAEDAVLAKVRAFVDPIPAFYIADGHHRAASSARVRDLLGPGPADRFMAVVFPHDQLRILAYHRVVADLHGQTPAAFLERLSRDFEVGPPGMGFGGAAPEPEARHTFGLYLDGAWRRLTARPHAVDESDPIRRLDVAILQDRVLAPLLGIEDPRSDRRISFVGGIRGTAELERRVDEAGAGCAFSMFPTSIEELFDVADRGLVMPPKSTWFEPKLGSGLLVNPLDGAPPWTKE